MPDKDKIQQALIDFDVTIKAKPNLSDKELLSKFPEFGNDINKLQAAKDYSATLNSGKYKDPSEFNSKFPEFFAEEVKKKEPTASSATPSQLPKISEQVSPLQQGANIVGGGVIGDISKTTSKEGTKKENDYFKQVAVGIKPSAQGNVVERIYENPMGVEVLQVEPKKREAAQQQPVQKAESKDKPLKGVKPIAPTKTELNEQGWLLNMVSAIDKGVYKTLGTTVQGAGTLLQGATSKITGGTGEGFISDALIKLGGSYNKMIDELTPQDESFKNSLSDQIGQALGFVGGLALTGGVSSAARGSSALIQQAPKSVALASAVKELVKGTVSPTGVVGGLTMGQAEFDRAKQSGATDEQAFEAFYKNAAVGSILERIPVMHFLKRFNQSTAGGVVNYIKTKGVAGLTGGLEEMTTEMLQQLYANKTAKDIYNENQDLFEGVAGNGTIGFSVGFLLNAMGANAKILRKQGRVNEAKLVENQVTELEEKAKGQAPTNNSIATKIAVNGNEEGLQRTQVELDNDLQKGLISEEEYQEKAAIAQRVAEFNAKIPDYVQGVNRAESIQLIEERENLQQELLQKEEQKKGVDVAYHKSIDESNKETKKRIDEINNQLGELAKPEKNKVEEVIQQPIEDKKEGRLTKDIKNLIYNKDEIVSDIGSDEAEILNSLVSRENISPKDAFRAFDGYKKNDYKIINEILRRGEEVTSETIKKIKSYVPESLLEDFGKIKRVLDSTVFSPIKKTTFYRNIFDEKADFLNDYKVGDEFSDKGISSVTIDEEFASEANRSFSESKKSKIPIIKYEIDNGESINGFYIGGTEKEFLINSGTKFIVTKKENIDGRLVITLKPKKEVVETKIKPEIVESVRAEQEPELPKGTKVVTLSGMEEGERVKAVEERKKKTTLTEKETLHNDLIDLANRVQKSRGNEKTNLQGQIRQRVRELNAKLGEEIYKYDGVSVRAKVKSKTKGERYLKIKGTTRDTSGRAIKEDAVLLFDRSPEFVQKYEELADSPNITALQVDSGNGVSMTAEQIESALQDIADGIPSVQADNLLNALEEGVKNGYFDLRGEAVGQKRIQAPIEDFIGVEQEEVGQPLDEDGMVEWLNEIAELPQEEQIEIDNIILEYEQQPQQIDISGKVQSPNAPSKTTSPTSPKPSKEGEGNGSPKAEVNKQPIGEAEPKQEDVEDADVFYHSTNKDFEGFDDKKIGTNKDFGWFGLGHYFTSNKEESKYYGKNVIEINISKIKDKIYKAVLSNQSIKIPKSVFEYIEKNLKNFKDYELGTYDNFKVGNLIDKEGSKVFSDAFKNEGYLGVRVSGDANELVIFESKNIPKSEPKTPLEEKYEQINKLRGEKAKELAKQKLISDNFDSIVAQLMTKNKIKRKC